MTRLRCLSRCTTRGRTDRSSVSASVLTDPPRLHPCFASGLSGNARYPELNWCGVFLLAFASAIFAPWSGSVFGAQGGDKQTDQESTPQARRDAGVEAEPKNRDQDPPVNGDQLLDGYLVRVPLPITQDVDSQVRRTIDRVLERLPNASASADRPILVLEFETRNGATGEGSQIGRCIELARYISGPELNRVRTVAYIPAPEGYVEPGESLTSRLRGHAVLVAIACESIAMHDDASIGAAGAGESAIDEFLEAAYRSIAQRRRTLPVPLVISMLDRQRSLYRVTTADGVLYLNEQELTQLQAGGEVEEVRTLSEPGSLAEFSSLELFEMQLIRQRVSNRMELAQRFRIQPDALQGDPSLGDRWRAVTLKFEGRINHGDVNWASNAVRRAVEGEGKNLLIIELDSGGGTIADALRFAQQIAELDPAEVRTIGYVPQKAKGGAAMIALACDHVVMLPDAQIGGPWDNVKDAEAGRKLLGDVESALQSLAEERGRDWSLFAAMLNPYETLKRYRNSKTGQIRLLLPRQHETLDDPDDWIEIGSVAVEAGLDGTRAGQNQITRYVASNYEEFLAFYQLSEPPVVLEPTVAHRWIEDLGRRLSSPWIAGWLLFGAMFFLSTEFSQPGLGVPGFLSAVCFFLFFWSQYCDGNVQWFELMLLAIGVVFVLVEIFVVPGFGVFGVGGLLMIIASLFLAMQTFVVPASSAELKQLPGSLAVVGAGIGGIVVAVAVIRHFLPRVPVFNRIILAPPQLEATTENLPSKGGGPLEDLIDQAGVAVTRLNPAGKVRVGQRMIDVVTDGRYIERDEAIVVQEVRGNRVVVGPLNTNPIPHSS